MSIGIGETDPSYYGLMSVLVGDSAGTKARLDKLATEAGTGRRAETYDGLGNDAAAALSLNPRIADLETWQANIDARSGALQVTQTAMTAIQQIASDFLAKTQGLNGLNPSAIDDTAAAARDALQQVAGLLNAQDGGVYVFAGTDSGNPPVPQAQSILSSGFFTQIASAVANLGTAGAPATITATLGIAASNQPGTSPFSAFLSQPASVLQSQLPTTQTGPGQFQAAGLLASANAVSVSAGSSTTGSYTRDLMRALATIGSLSSTQANAPGFAALVQDTQASLRGAIGAMADDSGILGQRQAALTDAKTTLDDTKTALTAQVSQVQDADMAQVLSSISLVQTQLQASYRLIAGLGGLSLAKMLPLA